MFDRQRLADVEIEKMFGIIINGGHRTMLRFVEQKKKILRVP